MERDGTDGVANAARLAELTGEKPALPKRHRRVYLATSRPFLGTPGGAGRRLARRRGARGAGGGGGLAAAGVSGGPSAATVSRARSEEV
eukprot:COSAG06_NODE_976_length_11249_cov_12.758386_3_plen_89_part_00